VSDEFVRVAQVADVAEGTATSVLVGEREVALFHVDGTFYALQNRCPHQGAPLCEGRITGQTVTCPWHAWTFRLEDGRMPAGFSIIDSFDVRVDGGTVAVRATPRPRPRRAR
jgi:NAD(P)H-dependent nitrite reductase small subunit